jgi:hypothetical protein
MPRFLFSLLLVLDPDDLFFNDTREIIRLAVSLYKQKNRAALSEIARLTFS